MAIRIGDIVDRHGVSYNVKNVDGSRILVEERLGGELNGPQTWRSSRGFVIAHTEWKEHITYVVTYKMNRDNVVKSSNHNTENTANGTKQTILRTPELYTLLALTKVTIPYKEPQ